jgi:hypothetical protein
LTEVIHQPDTEEYFRGNIDIVLDRYHILKKGNDNLTKQLHGTQTQFTQETNKSNENELYTYKEPIKTSRPISTKGAKKYKNDQVREIK